MSLFLVAISVTSNSLDLSSKACLRNIIDGRGERVFYHMGLTPRRELKKRQAAESVFNGLRGVWKYDHTLFRGSDILYVPNRNLN